MLWTQPGPILPVQDSSAIIDSETQGVSCPSISTQTFNGRQAVAAFSSTANNSGFNSAASLCRALGYVNGRVLRDSPNDHCNQLEATNGDGSAWTLRSGSGGLEYTCWNN